MSGRVIHSRLEGLSLLCDGINYSDSGILDSDSPAQPPRRRGCGGSLYSCASCRRQPSLLQVSVPRAVGASMRVWERAVVKQVAIPGGDAGFLAASHALCIAGRCSPVKQLQRGPQCIQPRISIGLGRDGGTPMLSSWVCRVLGGTLDACLCCSHSCSTCLWPVGCNRFFPNSEARHEMCKTCEAAWTATLSI